MKEVKEVRHRVWRRIGQVSLGKRGHLGQKDRVIRIYLCQARKVCRPKIFDQHPPSDVSKEKVRICKGLVD